MESSNYSSRGRGRRSSPLPPQWRFRGTNDGATVGGLRRDILPVSSTNARDRGIDDDGVEVDDDRATREMSSARLRPPYPRPPPPPQDDGRRDVRGRRWSADGDRMFQRRYRPAPADDFAAVGVRRDTGADAGVGGCGQHQGRGEEALSLWDRSRTRSPLQRSSGTADRRSDEWRERPLPHEGRRRIRRRRRPRGRRSPRRRSRLRSHSPPSRSRSRSRSRDDYREDRYRHPAQQRHRHYRRQDEYPGGYARGDYHRGGHFEGRDARGRGERNDEVRGRPRRPPPERPERGSSAGSISHGGHGEWRSRRQERVQPQQQQQEQQQQGRPAVVALQEAAMPVAGVVSDDEEFGAAAVTEVAVRPPGEAGIQHRPCRSASVRDDTIGHFRGGPGVIIADRYRIVREVGVGTFGRVVECLDVSRRLPDSRRHRGRDCVAIKIVRNVKRYYESALIEAQIVEDVNRRGGRGMSHCVVMHDSFAFGGHYCMVFESLGSSLYDFMKRHKYQPFPMVCVQDFTVQLLETLEFLHSFRLIHTDLKIENILLVSNREVSYYNQRVPECTRIKVIDFGGACYDHDKKSSVINTRQYRAPEVILNTGWSMPSDMWSAGCILAELYMGELLFATHDNLEHLALIERSVGAFPRRMLKKARATSDLVSQAFDSRGRHRMGRVLPAENAAFVEKAVPLEASVRGAEDSWFLDLLRMILVIDPSERATAHECLKFLARIRKDVVRYS